MSAENTSTAPGFERLAALPPYAAPPLTIHDSVRYQGASGDLNPIHHDPAFAEKAGFPEPFAVGMRQVGLLSDRVTDWFGPEALRSIDVRFRAQAWPGEALTYTCEALGTTVADGELTVTVGLACLKPDGTAHLGGTAICSMATDSDVAQQFRSV